MRFFLEGLITSVLHDTEVVCVERDYLVFPPPPGLTCGQYMTPFFQNGGTGYLADADATDLCKYCSYNSGSEWYVRYDWDYSNKWYNFGIIVGFWAFDIVVSCLLIYIFRKPRR